MISSIEFTVNKTFPDEPNEPEKAVGARRGRKPRCIIPVAPPGEDGQIFVLPSVIEIRKDCCGSAVALRLKGVLDTFTVIELRDAVFTVIGARPSDVCLDLNGVSVPLSPLAMETLVTMSRVASLVGVRFSVLVPAALTAEWQNAGLSQLLPVQTDPYFLAALENEEVVQ